MDFSRHSRAEALSTCHMRIRDNHAERSLWHSMNSMSDTLTSDTRARISSHSLLASPLEMTPRGCGASLLCHIKQPHTAYVREASSCARTMQLPPRSQILAI